MKAFKSIKEAMDRIDITGITQTLVAAIWVWQGRAADAWAPLGAGLKARRLEVLAQKGRLRTCRDEANDALDVLHNLTVQGLGMARAKYRRNPTVLKSLSLLFHSWTRRTRCGWWCFASGCNCSRQAPMLLHFNTPTLQYSMSHV